MKIRWMVRTAALCAAGVGLTFAVPAAAQYNRNQPGSNRQGNNARRQPPRNFIADLRALADDLSKQQQVRIVVDPAIFVAAKPSAPEAGATVDKAMDALVAQVKNTAWRRVYLQQAQANALPAPEKLAAVVRALDEVEQNGIVLENPATKRGTTLIKNYPIAQGFKEDLAAGQFSDNPVYVLYSTAAGADMGGATPADRMVNLQRQQMELMMQMDPEQMSRAMEQGMQMYMNLDPQTRMQFMGNMMRAGMQMWANMPPQMRQEMMQGVMQMFQQGGIPGMGPGGGPGGPPPPGGPGGPRR